MPKTQYAARTVVSEENTKAEIESTLRRFGAEAFGSAWDGTGGTVHHLIYFKLGGQPYRITVPMPEEKEFQYTPVRLVTRSPVEQRREWDQAKRQRLRALLLVIKAKLAAVEAGITTLEQEFFSNLMLPSGQTMSEWAGPQFRTMIAQGQMPPMLGRGKEHND